MKKPVFVCAVVLLSLFAWFVWPTRYRRSIYAGKLPMREDRFTGKVELFYPSGGWHEVGTPAIVEQPSILNSQQERVKPQ